MDTLSIEFLKPVHFLFIDPDIAAKLEKDLTVVEIASAILSMQSSKNLPDGFATD